MPCFHYNIKGIGRVHIRAGKRAKLPPPCVQCHDMSEYLCDFEIVSGVTCDAPLCKDHAHEIGPDKHYCPRHLAEIGIRFIICPCGHKKVNARDELCRRCSPS